MRIIDLSANVEVNSGEPVPLEYERVDCKQGAKLICDNVKNKWGMSDVIFNVASFPDEEFISKESIKLETHTGTHIDAPSHFGSKCEGKMPRTIDQCPLEWFFGNGVLLEITKKCGEYISKNDIMNELLRKEYTLKGGDIVLIYTGTCEKWGTEEYFYDAPGMSEEATKYILSFGVKVIGIDTYSFDRPFKNMIQEYFVTGENSCLWPAHMVGREKEYVHIERMINLSSLIDIKKFTVCSFPIKLKNMDAAWTRAVALIDE